MERLINISAMMVRLCLSIGLILAVSTASAATIYVDGQLSGDCNGTYSVANRDCSGNDGDAYNTLAEAANVATAGDTVLIRSGTYNQQLRPAHSGTVSGTITFGRYRNETVTISLGSDIAIDISDRNYIILDGLAVDESRWLEAENAHYNVIRNCTFTNSWATGTTGNVRFISSSHNKILNNVIDEGNDNLLLIDSDHNLVQGNTITEGRHSLWGIRCGDYNVIRDNYFSNTQQKIGEVYDCGDGHLGRAQLIRLDQAQSDRGQRVRQVIQLLRHDRRQRHPVRRTKRHPPLECLPQLRGRARHAGLLRRGPVRRVQSRLSQRLLRQHLRRWSPFETASRTMSSRTTSCTGTKALAATAPAPARPRSSIAVTSKATRSSTTTSSTRPPAKR